MDKYSVYWIIYHAFTDCIKYNIDVVFHHSYFFFLTTCLVNNFQTDAHVHIIYIMIKSNVEFISLSAFTFIFMLLQSLDLQKDAIQLLCQYANIACFVW